MVRMVVLYIYLAMALMVLGRVLFGYLAKWEKPSRVDAKLVVLWPWYMVLAVADFIQRGIDTFSEASGLK